MFSRRAAFSSPPSPRRVTLLSYRLGPSHSSNCVASTNPCALAFLVSRANPRSAWSMRFRYFTHASSQTLLSATSFCIFVSSSSFFSSSAARNPRANSAAFAFVSFVSRTVTSKHALRVSKSTTRASSDATIDSTAARSASNLSRSRCQCADAVLIASSSARSNSGRAAARAETSVASASAPESSSQPR